MRESELKGFPLQRTFDLIGAIASGYWLGVFHGLTRNSGEVGSEDYYTCIFRATISFTVAGAFVILAGQRRILRVPYWIVLLTMGAFLSFISIVTIPNLTYEWGLWKRANPMDSLSDELPGSALALLFFAFFDAVVTLPVMLAFHFLPRLFSFVKRRPAH